MGFSVHSLRTRIIGHLAFLILSAMLLINVVLMKFAEKDLVQGKLREGRILLQGLERELGRALQRDRGLQGLEQDPDIKAHIERLLAAAGFQDLLAVDRAGLAILEVIRQGTVERAEALASARQALAEGKPSFEFSGSAWGVIWLSPERVRISVPLMVRGMPAGGMTTGAPLDPLYASLRNNQRLILAYVGLNTVLLVLFGIYLLSRSVVKPIHRLLRLSEEFREPEAFVLVPEAPRDEIGELHRSLSLMLRRLKEDEKVLKHHIDSLEKANSDLRTAQEEVVRSEKLASAGRLATGIAHEIGNPLGIVLGYLDLLRRGGLTESEKTDFLERVESEIQRINRIIRQLLDFSRPGRGDKTLASVHQLLLDTLRMMEPQPMMADLECRRIFEARQAHVCCDPGRLQQVFVNILMNAADAMGGKDRSSEQSTPSRLTIETENGDGFIEIRFSDTGPGIPEEEIRQVFDPFFTTKEPGKGTGLGLSVSHSIVQDLGGTIRARSTAGKGTTIIIRLPVCEPEDRS